MLELAILGLLLESPMHGYELRKRLTGLLGAFRAFSYGSLYPALRRMQTDGLIAEDAAPEGAVLRRARRVYQLTDAGRQRFTELVADTGPRTTPMTGSACIWRSSIGRRPPRECGFSKAAAGRWRSVEKVFATRSLAPATHWIDTPGSCISWDWSPASGKSSGSTN